MEALPQIQWLAEVVDGHWFALAEAMRSGFPVPAGFVAGPQAGEEDIRSAYEELKHRERTHFAAIRGPAQAQLDVLGSDNIVHAMRRAWTLNPEARLLIQRMVNSEFCGTAGQDEKISSVIRIRASEGMRLLDSDTYLYDTATDRCTRHTLQQKQRKVIRDIDGRTITIRNNEKRMPLSAEHLDAIAALAKSAQIKITWALDAHKLWRIG